LDWYCKHGPDPCHTGIPVYVLHSTLASTIYKASWKLSTLMSKQFARQRIGAPGERPSIPDGTTNNESRIDYSKIHHITFDDAVRGTTHKESRIDYSPLF